MIYVKNTDLLMSEINGVKAPTFDFRSMQKKLPRPIWSIWGDKKPYSPLDKQRLKKVSTSLSDIFLEGRVSGYFDHNKSILYPDDEAERKRIILWSYSNRERLLAIRKKYGLCYLDADEAMQALNNRIWSRGPREILGEITESQFQTSGSSVVEILERRYKTNLRFSMYDVLQWRDRKTKEGTLVNIPLDESYKSNGYTSPGFGLAEPVDLVQFINRYCPKLSKREQIFRDVIGRDSNVIRESCSNKRGVYLTLRWSFDYDFFLSIMTEQERYVFTPKGCAGADPEVIRKKIKASLARVRSSISKKWDLAACS